MQGDLCRTRRVADRGTRKNICKKKNQSQRYPGILLPRFGGLKDEFNEFSVESNKEFA